MNGVVWMSPNACVCALVFCQWNQIQEKKHKHRTNWKISHFFTRASSTLRKKCECKLYENSQNVKNKKPNESPIIGMPSWNDGRGTFFLLINKRKIIHKNIVHRCFCLHFSNTIQICTCEPSKQACGRAPLFADFCYYFAVFSRLEFTSILLLKTHAKEEEKNKSLSQDDGIFMVRHIQIYLHTNSPNPYPSLNQKFQFR